MTKPGSERQEWLDFTHTVDVLTSSALAKSDIGDSPVRFRGGLRHAFATQMRKRAFGGAMAAACLLILALPAIYMVPSVGDRHTVPSTSLPKTGSPDLISLKITSLKPSYQPGETLSYTLQTNQSCYPLIYTIDADNKVKLHDVTPGPGGAGSSTPSLKSDAPLTVTGSSGPDLTIAPPKPGTYTIGALCSRDTLTKLGTSYKALADAAEAGGTKFLAYLAELTKVLKPNQLAAERLTYEVN